MREVPASLFFYNFKKATEVAISSFLSFLTMMNLGAVLIIEYQIIIDPNYASCKAGFQRLDAIVESFVIKNCSLLYNLVLTVCKLKIKLTPRFNAMVST